MLLNTMTTEQGNIPSADAGQQITSASSADAAQQAANTSSVAARQAASASSANITQQAANSKSVCPICPHACALTEGQRGICRARIARDGVVVDENYGRVTSLALDPIEKKPLARFMPGSSVLSIGSYGCNMSCCFCQNASIAQACTSDVPWTFYEPDIIADMAAAFAAKGTIGVAYTYNEPLVGFEFVRDCSQAVHERGLANVLVSNGQVNPAPRAELLDLIDAANIDLKGFTQDVYRKLGGDLDTTLATIEAFAHAPTLHLEVTMLVVPGLNDSLEQLVGAAKWLAQLDRAIPLHITRFFPCYRMLDAEPTPLATIHTFVEAARAYLDFVYPGNC